MASSSGSPRSRIDQFFVARKRKPLLSQSEKIGEDSKSTFDASPSAKGTLDGYLVKSPDDKSRVATQLQKDRCSLLKTGIAKRNLELEINLDSVVTGKPVSPSHSSGRRESELKVEEPRGVPAEDILEAPFDGVGSNDLHADEKTAEAPTEGTGNTELKKFATDFLSLYCSEIPSAVSFEVDQKLNGHKRNGSPSLLAANSKFCTKKQCLTAPDDLPTEGMNLPSHIGCSANEESASRIISEEAVAGNSRELDVVVFESCRKADMADRESFAGLRKCNNTPTSGMHEGGCNTPASLNMSSTRKTPKSAYRSSIFSPGEDFWNEAIHVADCLFVPAEKSSVQASGGHNELDHLESGTCQNKLPEDACCSLHSEDAKNMAGVEANCGARPLDVDACLKLTNKDYETVAHDNKASPLPVRHFDFTFEENNFDDNRSRRYFNNQMKDAIHQENGNTQIDHVSGKIIEISNALHYSDAPPDEHTSGEKLKFLPASLGMGVDDLSSLAVESPQTSDSTSTVKVEECKQRQMSDSGLGTVHNDKDRTRDPAQPCKIPGVDEEFKSRSIVDFKYDLASTPSSSVLLKDSLKLSSWLPSEICSVYTKKGISLLYPWQVDCLQVDGVLEKRNLVYCASTSAGKSFVAEILILRQVISMGKMALLVLPYVSICSEKAEHLELLLEPLGKHVRSFYGNQGGGSLPKDTSVAVCTIEKANSLINRLLEEGRLSEVGIIVIDELHMVGDQHRGYLLELILTKLRYASGEGHAESLSEETTGSNSGKSDLSRGLQIVGMSATMPNVAAVADWLHAALYQTDFRPVPLEEYIKVGSNIFSKKLDIIRTIPKTADLGGKDPDHVVKLCDEVVQEGHSVLIFCSSRKGCESTARHVSKFLKGFSAGSREAAGEYSDAASVLEALKRCPAGLDPILEETIPSGVAYHHAGLTVEEREIVETCYRKGLIRVLTATSTLAAGVNLPARRVIFRQPRIGRDFIDGTRYRQMAGRAGRTGIDTKGESILVCKQEEVKRITAMLNDCCPPLQSCLSDDKNGMTHAILEVVAGGIVQTASDIHRYVRCTLLNSTKPFEAVVKSAQDSLRWLCHNKFLEWNEQTQLYTATPLGHASFGSSLSPEESLVVLDDFSRAREGFVLASDLHLVYLVTPINVDVEPDWELYYERFMELSTLDQSVGNRVGVTEPFLMRKAHGAPMHIPDSLNRKKNQLGRLQSLVLARNSRLLSDDQTLRVAKRLYVALMLSRLVQEIPIPDVCEAFKVARGMIQVLQENSGRFASMVSLFCERLGWPDFGGLIAKFQNRVSFGVRSEIAELTNIPYVKGSRARALYKAGLRTPLAIAEASIPAIAKALFESSLWDAQEGTSMQRIQLGVAKKIKNGACKIVLDQAEEARVAAFSAFKSLGVDIPQLSRPLLPANFKGSMQVANMPSDVLDATSASGCIQDKETTLIGAASDSKNGNVHYNDCLDTGEKRLSETGNSISRFVEAIKPSIAIHDSINSAPSLNCDPIVNVSAIKESRDASCFKNTRNAGSIDGNAVDSPNPDQYSFSGRGHMTGYPSSNMPEKGPINVSTIRGGFDSFLDQWDAITEFYFDVHFAKRSELESLVPFEIFGMAVCWLESPVYYINLSRDLIPSVTVKPHEGVCGTSIDDKGKVISLEDLWKAASCRWGRMLKIMGRCGVRKFTWNLKYQIQVLKSPGISIQRFGGLHFEDKGKNSIKLVGDSHILLPSINVYDGIDLCLVAWILWPDEESRCSPNLEKVVKKRLTSEAVAAANRDGRWRNQMHRAAHNGCCRRVAQIRALSSVLWKLLVSENLIDALTDIENPLVKVLADMELWGIGVDMEACLHSKKILGRKLKELEKEAYKLAGRSFSLYTSADIANVLYTHLKLPVPEGTKGKQHPSTDKHSLDLLRCQHPIVSIIREHRTLAKLLNSTMGSISSRARLCVESQRHIVMGRWLQTSTATGRLSMEEPNLQCVEHTVKFTTNSSLGEHHQINARDFFIPTQENWVLLTADYSQIELRLMAHFSQDFSLIELLSRPDGDVFSMIAARWTGKLESVVRSEEREQTKRLVYGILYGMGANTLAEHLDCRAKDAAEKIRSFKDSFPGVSAWLQKTVASCRSKGYVQTLKGRKRFLSKINSGTNKEKAKAQRQAVNSICQGSAADIIKIAMINIHSLVTEGCGSNSFNGLGAQYSALKGRCHILLQVHDELVLEVDPSLVREAGLLLKSSMESAVTLLVPLRVKLKAGNTWGSLEPFNVKLGT